MYSASVNKSEMVKYALQHALEHLEARWEASESIVGGTWEFLYRNSSGDIDEYLDKHKKPLSESCFFEVATTMQRFNLVKATSVQLQNTENCFNIVCDAPIEYVRIAIKHWLAAYDKKHS